MVQWYPPNCSDWSRSFLVPYSVCKLGNKKSWFSQCSARGYPGISVWHEVLEMALTWLSKTPRSRSIIQPLNTLSWCESVVQTDFRKHRTLKWNFLSEEAFKSTLLRSRSSFTPNLAKISLKHEKYIPGQEHARDKIFRMSNCGRNDPLEHIAALQLFSSYGNFGKPFQKTLAAHWYVFFEVSLGFISVTLEDVMNIQLL